MIFCRSWTLIKPLRNCNPVLAFKKLLACIKTPTMFHTLIDPRDIMQGEETLESDVILEVQNVQGKTDIDLDDWEVTTEAEFS
jgi:hypothetical protein